MIRAGGAVLGSPIAHSLSPVLHQAAYTELGLAGWSYRAVECTSDELPGALRALEADGLAGVSLTMPLKRAVVPLLARVDRTAAQLGVVNTVLFGGLAADWWGANTDVHGIVASLRGPGTTPWRAADEAWVLGAGATAASAIAALSELGVRRVVVVARRPDSAVALVDVGAGFGVDVEIRDWSSWSGCAHARLVVSTTPAGATDGLAADLGQPAGLLLEVVYAPWPTPLAAAWERGGGRVVGGLELLVQQAAEQVRLMTGKAAPVDVMRAAGQAARSARLID